MKKFIIIAAAAGFLFAGCAIDDGGKLSQTKTPQQITFNNPVISPNTRAAQPGEIAAPYPTNETFNVYANRSEDNYAAWETTAPNLYMDNVLVKYDSGLNAWAPETPYLWPETGKLTFAAYSPTGGAGTVTYGPTGFVFTDFEVNANLAQQYDLMYSDRSYNKEASTGGPTYNGVDINFKHALSSIHFQVRTDIEYAQEFKVTMIKLNNIIDKGTFNENITDGPTYVAAPAWTPGTETESYKVFDGELVLTKDYQKITDKGGKYAILLPQEFAPASAPSITVSWSLAGLAQSDVTVPLSDIKFTVDGADAAAWKMGYRYTYNLIFTSSTGPGGERRIFFSPEVDKWNDDAKQVPNPGTDVKPGNDGQVL